MHPSPSPVTAIDRKSTTSETACVPSLSIQCAFFVGKAVGEFQLRVAAQQGARPFLRQTRSGSPCRTDPTAAIAATPSARQARKTRNPRSPPRSSRRARRPARRRLILRPRAVYLPRSGHRRNRMTRSHFCAKLWLWVTRTSVAPWRSRSPNKQVHDGRAPFVSSRFPVGSSASRICGRGAAARASATRCCSPPDNCAG